MLKLEKFKNNELKALEEIKGGDRIITFASGETWSVPSSDGIRREGPMNIDCIDDMRISSKDVLERFDASNQFHIDTRAELGN
jgi:hypothetical protein